MAIKLNHSNQVNILEHEDSTSLETKRVLLYGWNSDTLEKTRVSTDASGSVSVKATSLPLPSGAATADKQLPDNHNVTVSNPTADPETGLAKDLTLTSGTSKFQIVDSGGEAVSVTGGKLDVNSSAPVGGSTEVKQDVLNALIETIQELVQRLAPLAGAVSNTAQLRVVATEAVTASGGGYITSAQSTAEKTQGGVDYTNRVAANNLTTIQSNINNVSIT